MIIHAWLFILNPSQHKVWRNKNTTDLCSEQTKENKQKNSEKTKLLH